MFRKRNAGPRGFRAMGIFFLIFGALVLIPSLMNLDASTRLGIPFWLAAIVMILIGGYMLAYGLVWIRRDNEAGREDIPGDPLPPVEYPPRNDSASGQRDDAA